MPKEQNRPSYMNVRYWKRLQKQKHPEHKPFNVYPADPEYALGDQLTKAGITYEREFKITLHSHGCNYAKVDFLIQGWLVVEIDGPSHLSKEKEGLRHEEDPSPRGPGIYCPNSQA